MTIEELKNYRKMVFTIRYWRKELEDARRKSYLRSPAFSGMPGAGRISDPTAERATAEVKIIERIRRLEAEQEKELDRIMEWIQNIEDPMMQAIMFARYIRGKSWDAVAISIGGGNTADAVRKMHTRYLSVLSEK